MAKVHHMTIKKAQRLADAGELFQSDVDAIANGETTIELALDFRSQIVPDIEEEVVEPNLCLCGCDEPVAKGRRFRQGHDQRMVSLANKYVEGDLDYALEDAQMAYLQESGKLERAQERYDERTRQADAKAREDEVKQKVEAEARKG